MGKGVFSHARRSSNLDQLVSVRAPILGCCSASVRISSCAVKILQRLTMKASLLDPHAADLRSRARQGYTQRMLQLYLRSKSLRVSQSTISRWLCKHGVNRLPPLPQNEEFAVYQYQTQICLQAYRYRRALSRWSDHIWHMRSRGASLPEIQEYLRRHGVVTSTKSIYRELKMGTE